MPVFLFSFVILGTIHHSGGGGEGIGQSPVLQVVTLKK